MTYYIKNYLIKNKKYFTKKLHGIKKRCIFVSTKTNNMTTLVFSTQELERGHAEEMSKIAKEQVCVELCENDDLFVFGSELACLRIALYFCKYKEVKVNYSETYKSYFVALYSGK